MKNEQGLGNLLFQDGSTMPQVARRILLLLLPAVILFAFGFILYFDPSLIGESTEKGGSIPLILLIATPLYSIMVLFIVKGFRAVIYEHGFSVKHGRKTMHWYYNQVRNITLSTTPIVALTIESSSGKRLSLFGAFTPNLRQFAEYLDSVYSNYKIRTITPQTMHHANISFGKLLDLADGCFVFKKGKAVIPLSAVYKIEIEEEGMLDVYTAPEVKIYIEGGKRVLAIPLSHMANMNIFRQISHMLPNYRQ